MLGPSTVKEHKHGHCSNISQPRSKDLRNLTSQACNIPLWRVTVKQGPWFMSSMVCICLASSSPGWVTGHCGVWRCSVSTRRSAQVEMWPSEMNSLTLMHTLVNYSVLPLSGRGGWLTLVSLYIPILCLTFIVVKTHKYLFTLPLLSPNLWYSARFWTVHPLPVTIFTKEGPASGGISVHCEACAGCNGAWWVLALLLGSFHQPGPPAEPEHLQPPWAPQGNLTDSFWQYRCSLGKSPFDKNSVYCFIHTIIPISKDIPWKHLVLD